MDEIQNKFNTILKEYDDWVKGEVIEKKTNVDQIAGNATAPINTVYGKIQVDNFNMGKDLQSNLGSSKTQHGEAAEKLEVRARNKQHRLNGEDPSARSAENRIDTKADIYDNGNTYQVKFYKDPSSTFRSFMNEAHDYKGIKKIIPKEQYNEVMDIAKSKGKEYRDKAKECKKNGDSEGYIKNKELADKCDDLIKTAEPSKVTRNEAIQAAKHPTAKAMQYVVGDAIEAGAKAGATAAVVTGVVSGITNVFEVLDGNKNVEEALKDTAIAAGKSAVVGAAYGTSTSLIQGGAGVLAKHVVTNETAKGILEGIADSNAVTYVLVATVEFTKTLKLYFDKEIDEKQMLIRLGDTTVGMAGSILGGMIGTTFGPLGQIVGSTLGYLAASAFYHSVIEVVQFKSLAKEYEKIMPILKEAQEEMKKARKEFEQVCFQYRMARFNKVIDSMNALETSVNDNNMERFLEGLSVVMSLYGESVLYTDFEKFDNDMLDDSITITI